MPRGEKLPLTGVEGLLLWWKPQGSLTSDDECVWVSVCDWACVWKKRVCVCVVLVIARIESCINWRHLYFFLSISHLFIDSTAMKKSALSKNPVLRQGKKTVSQKLLKKKKKAKDSLGVITEWNESDLVNTVLLLFPVCCRSITHQTSLLAHLIKWLPVVLKTCW